MTDLTDAALRLFKALPLGDRTRPAGLDRLVETNRRTIPYGYIIDPALIQSYGAGGVIESINKLYGANPEQLNNSFHKSFAKVRDSSYATLVFEQLVHYLTTYGAEAVGVYDVESVYVPAEALDAPAIDIEGFDFVVIRAITDAQLRVELSSFLSLGVALSEQSVLDAVAVARAVGFTATDIEAISNREVQVRLYESLGLAPKDPVEFLRYVTYRLTGTSLLIKNESACQALSEAVQQQPYLTLSLFDQYNKQVGYGHLAEIFNRFKPLFLALRSTKELRPIINKISRFSKTNHTPMWPDYLNEVTARIRKDTLNFASLEIALRDANIFRKARLAQALAVRSNTELDSIVYKVRNGRSWVDDFKPFNHTQATYCGVVLHMTLQSIADGLSGGLSGKNIYIPAGVVYGLPATEKQFTGNFPTGTYVEAPAGEGLVAGIHWTDVEHGRVDLDLSLVSAGEKIGWDGYYRSDNSKVLFSGDMTSAPTPLGASEVFWFAPDANGEWLMNVNYFNYYSDAPVPYRIVVGTLSGEIERNFVLDPNTLLADASSVLDTRQAIVGLVTADAATGSRRFYFSASEGGGGISARPDKNSERARKFMATTGKTLPTLNDVLALSGAVLVDSPDKADDGLDLSPAKIDKTTILSLLGQG